MLLRSFGSPDERGSSRIKPLDKSPLASLEGLIFRSYIVVDSAGSAGHMRVLEMVFILDSRLAQGGAKDVLVIEARLGARAFKPGTCTMNPPGVARVVGCQTPGTPQAEGKRNAPPPENNADVEIHT